MLSVAAHGDSEKETAKPEVIVIEAARTSRSADQIAAPVMIKDRENLDKNIARDLAGILDSMPGVTSAGGPRSAAMSPNIRGMSNGRVVMRMDGARQNFNLSHRGQSFLDPSLLQRVEVMSGPASSLHGSGAIGGVIHFRTMDSEDFLHPGETMGARAGSVFESNGGQTQGSVTLAGRHDEFGLLGSLGWRKADDFDDGSGDPVEFTGYDSVSGLLNARWTPADDLLVRLGYQRFHDDNDSLATADRAAGDEITRKTRQDTTSLNTEYQPADSDWLAIKASLYHTGIELDEKALDGSSRSIHQLDTVGLDIHNTSHLPLASHEHTLTYGFEAYRDRQKGSRDDQPNLRFSDSRQNTFGLFIQDRIDLNKHFSSTLGVRYDRIEQSADRDNTEDSQFTELSPQLALHYNALNGFSTYLSYAQAFRAPSLRELYVGGQHFPGNDYEPNPDLQPEVARNKEAGLRYMRSNLRTHQDELMFRANVFQNDISDFIEQVVDNVNNITRFENVDNARIRGMEAELNYATGRYYLALSGAVLRGDDRGKDLPLQSIPADQLRLELARRLSDAQLDMGVRLSLVRAQNRVPGTPHTIDPTPAYEVLDLFASWYPNDHLTVNVGLDNVTNETYRHHLSPINERGRNIKIAVGYRF